MSETVETRRRRLLFRAEHRGFKEADLVIGGFARKNLPVMDAAALDEFEALINTPDQDLYAWIVGREQVPDEFRGPVFDALAASAVAVSKP
ncbi:FAD assembly factor SdhE [Hyphobacterium indicum]|uniref:FAD assembly factor SdhE n=1 Tax=Hyphobacterium indicum TaxID=2162714 RepID=UPI000D6491AE|nr:succinate dehydrogenase assembly factor 2 [Hyphobacterium indicum]